MGKQKNYQKSLDFARRSNIYKKTLLSWFRIFLTRGNLEINKKKMNSDLLIATVLGETHLYLPVYFP